MRFVEMQFISNCYTVVSYYAMFRHSIYKNSAVYLSVILQDTDIRFPVYEAPFLDLHLTISDGFVSSKVYDKRDDFDFDLVNFTFLDGNVPRATYYGVYISHLIRFAGVSSLVTDLTTRNKILTAKFLKQGYRYHKLRK